MDWNVVMVSGVLDAPTVLRTLDSGAVVATYQVTVKATEPRRRTDVILITQWNPPSEASTFSVGTRVQAVGSIQRRFWEGASGRHGRVEFVASRVVREDPTDASWFERPC